MAGIKLNHGGTYDNTGGIAGTYYGIEIYGGIGTVMNSGSITANYDGSVGVLLEDGGSVTNSAGAIISGSFRGVYIEGSAGSVTNAGSIADSGAFDALAVYLKNGGTVTNSGTITGIVKFGGSGANTLILQTGSDITNAVYGSTAAGATNALVLTGSGLTDHKLQFFSTLSVNASGTWTLEKGYSFPITTVSTGTLAIAASMETRMTEAAAATVTIGGGLTLNGDSNLSGTIAGSGTLVLSSAATTFSSGSMVTVSNFSVDGGSTTFASGATVTVTNLSISGGSTTFASGATATVTNLSIFGGSATFGSGATVTASNWSIQQGAANLVFAALFTYSGEFDAESGAVMTLSGNSLVLAGGATFSGATTAGSQGLTDSGTTNVSGLTIGNTAGFSDTGLLTQSGEVTLGDAHGDASLIKISASGTWNVTDDTGIDLGSSKSLSIYDNGLFEKISGTGVSVIAPAFVNSGKVLVTSGTLDFQGAYSGGGACTVSSANATLQFTGASTLSGTIAGLGTLELGGGAKTFTSSAKVTVSSLAIFGGSTTFASGATVTVTNLSISGGSLTVAGGGKVTVSSLSISNGSAKLGGALTCSGKFSASNAVLVSGGELLLAGAVNFAGSDTVSATSILLTGTVDFAGAVTVSGSAMLMTGNVQFVGATILGSQTVTASGHANVSGLTVATAGGFVDQGLLTEIDTVTLGDTLGDSSLLTIAKTGTWNVTDDSDIYLGSSKSSSMYNSGLFEKISGTGVSVIAPAFVNSGETLDTTGTLDFKRAVTGKGTDVIAGTTAILEFDSTVANTQTIDFLRPDGVLLLGAPTGFAGVLSGFDTIFTSEAVELLGSWSIKNYAQTTAAEGTLTLTSGTQTASIAFDGSYRKTGFHASAFGGETIVTYI